MAGYQPITIAPSTAGADLADFFSNMRKEKRQARNDAFSQAMQEGEARRAQGELDIRRERFEMQRHDEERQRQNAEQDKLRQVHEHVQKLHNAGLGKQAMEIAKIYGLTATPEDIGPEPEMPNAPSAPVQTALGDIGPGTLPPAEVDQVDDGRAGLVFPGQTPDDYTTENVPSLGNFGGPLREGQMVPVEGPVDLTPEQRGLAAGPFVGPIDSPEHARSLAMSDPTLFGDTPNAPGDFAANEVMQQEAQRQREIAERNAFAQEQAAYPGQVDDYKSRRADYEMRGANPSVTYKGAGGEFTVDPREQIMAARAEQQAAIKRVQDTLGAEESTKGLAPRIAAEIGAGRTIDQAMDDQTKRELAGVTAENRIDVAKLRKPRGGGGGAASKLKAENAGMTLEGKYDQAAQKVLANFKYVDVAREQAKIHDMATSIAGANDNAALAAITAGSFAKYAQGGTGVVSDRDMKVFWDRIGGLGLRTTQAIQSALDGTLTPEKQKIVDGAIKEMLANSNRRQNEVGRALESTFTGLPGGPERLPRYLKTYSPGYKPGAKDEPQAAPGGGGATKKLKMPDGSIAEFDASGKRVK